MERELQKLRTAVGQVCQEIGARLALLIGSAAREEPRPPEDLDIAILGPGPLDTVDVTNRLIRRLQTQRVDVVDLARADPLLLALAARDGVLLYEAGAGELAHFASLAQRRYADTRKFREMEREEIRDYVSRGHR